MITVQSVTKSYRGVTAVDDVTFTAEPGRVTGFLGPNGAGKSTTMRILVGLTPPTSGHAEVCGRRFADLPNPGREVGVLLDASAQHAGRTGREILTLSQRLMGLPAAGSTSCSTRSASPPRSLVARVRRLLARACASGSASPRPCWVNPEVLILDEPANGLDPAGIRWMRDLLRGYADGGATVLLSSHLLHEIEVVADDLVVIGNGRIVAQGTKEDAAALRRHPRPVPRGRPPRPGTDRRRPQRRPERGHRFAGRPAGGGPARRRRADSPTWPAAPLTELRAAEGAGLEEMFLELTADTQREGAVSMSTLTTLTPATDATCYSTHRTPVATTPAATSLATPARPATRHTPSPWRASCRSSCASRSTPARGSGSWSASRVASVLATAPWSLFSGDGEATASSFTLAIGFPMAVILPMVAILSVTGEWSQRSGLTTFTLVPHRGRVVLAKGIVAGTVSLASMLSPSGSAPSATSRPRRSPAPTPSGTRRRHDRQRGARQHPRRRHGLHARAAHPELDRRDRAYFVYAFVLPPLLEFLAATQDWFHDLHPWVDPNVTQHLLFHGPLVGVQWQQLAVTSTAWLLLPLAVGLWTLRRSEVN